MRREKRSLARAAREAGVPARTVLRHVRTTLRKVNGRWRARPQDRLPRSMRFYSPEGEVPITVLGSKDASKISEYHVAVKQRLETGDSRLLQRFQGEAVLDAEGRRHPFITDPAALHRLARAGVFSGFEDIYSLSS